MALIIFLERTGVLSWYLDAKGDVGFELSGDYKSS